MQGAADPLHVPTEAADVFRIRHAVKATKSNQYIWLLTGISAISSALFGIDTGVISGALLSIRDDLHLAAWQQEAVVAVTTIGAVIGSLSGGQGNERLGRRMIILVSSVLFTLGALFMGFAFGFWTLVLGRFIVGLAVGLSSMTIPIYIAEAAPTAMRGTLVTMNTCFITAGQFIAGMIDGIFATTTSGWRYMLGLAAIPAAFQFIGILFMPESPRWLISKGNAYEGRRVLEKLRGSTDVDEEVRAIEDDVGRHSQQAQMGLREMWQKGSIRRALTLGCGLMALQQLSGINTVMYYSASIYNMAGFADTAAIWLAGFTALAQFVGMVGNMLLVERLGRRTLLLSSLALVTLSLVLIGRWISC